MGKVFEAVARLAGGTFVTLMLGAWIAVGTLVLWINSQDGQFWSEENVLNMFMLGGTLIAIAVEIILTAVEMKRITAYGGWKS